MYVHEHSSHPGLDYGVLLNKKFITVIPSVKKTARTNANLHKTEEENNKSQSENPQAK